MIKSLNAHLVVFSEHNVLCALEGWRSWQKSVWGDARCLVRVRRTRSGTPHHVSFRNTSLLFSDRNRKARREASLTACLSGSVSGSVWEPAELVGGAGGDHRAAGGSAGAAAQVRQSSYHIILFWALLVRSERWESRFNISVQSQQTEHLQWAEPVKPRLLLSEGAVTQQLRAHLDSGQIYVFICCFALCLFSYYIILSAYLYTTGQKLGIIFFFSSHQGCIQYI